MPRHVFVVEGLILLTLFVLAPATSAVIGYAAWKGKPNGLDRSTYALGFVVIGIVSCVLMVYAQRLQADVRTPQYACQAACFEIGALLFGVAGGCMVGIFACRRRGR